MRDSSERAARTIDPAAGERWLLTVPIVAALLLVVGGFLLAWYLRSPEWTNRSGAAVVAVESIIVVLESKRRSRLERISSVMLAKNPYVRQEIERAESQVLWIAVPLAVCGELLHGFGDLISGLLI